MGTCSSDHYKKGERLIHLLYPQVITNSGLSLDYGDSALISSIVLDAHDGDNDNEHIYYIIKKLPTKGMVQYCPDPFSATLDLDCVNLGVSDNINVKIKVKKSEKVE